MVDAADGAGSGAKEWHWSLWDRVDVAGPLTLRQFVEHVQTLFGAQPTVTLEG